MGQVLRDDDDCGADTRLIGSCGLLDVTAFYMLIVIQSAHLESQPMPGMVACGRGPSSLDSGTAF